MRGMELEKLPNVIEVYPQVRFYTEVRFNNKPFATVVAGLPESSRNSGAFEGMQGNFFFAERQRSHPANRLCEGSFGEAGIIGWAGVDIALCRTPGNPPKRAAMQSSNAGGTSGGFSWCPKSCG